MAKRPKPTVPTDKLSAERAAELRKLGGYATDDEQGDAPPPADNPVPP